MKTNWNLGLLYKGHDDPQIEKDMQAIEKSFAVFEKKYRGKTDYLKNEAKLATALADFEALIGGKAISKPLYYFQYTQDLNSNDTVARARSTQLLERYAKNEHKIVFFELALAKIPANLQRKFLASKKLAHFKYFLTTTFNRAKYDLTEPEEKILGLMAIPAFQQWLTGTDKLLNKQTVDFDGKKLPISEAMQKIHDLPLAPRRRLHGIVMNALAGLADVAESEMNAIVTKKKITDELRGFKEPYDQTILGYENDRKSVLALVSAVTKHFPISHKFYALKAKILKLPHLEYCDHRVGIGENEGSVSFEEAVRILEDAFGNADSRYLSILQNYLTKGQIDVYPKVGKTGGAYCSGSLNLETFVLLNYTNSIDQVMTFAHEMGHAIHTELSKSQTALYQGYSTSTAEVASTFFESIVFDALFEKMSKEEKIKALHKKINDDILTVFRQIACFNFETELHTSIRAKGEISKDEIGSVMNKHMKAYLGPIMKMNDMDGNFFVYWSHIRRFFYVYSYAFGQLISKALYAEYKKNPAFIKKVNQFLSSGGSASPESIFKSIGIDVTKPDFWEKGLKSIESDIMTLERLTKSK